MDFLQDIVTKHKDFVQKCADDAEVIKQECDSYFKEIDLFLKTENVDFFKPNTMGKENMESAGVTKKRRGRLRKPALADVTETNILQPDTVIIKKEKISIIQEELEPDIQIKKEIDEMPAPRRLPPRTKKIKAEVDFPKRSMRTRTKKNGSKDDIISKNENTRATTNSDVIIQDTTITTIEISDNEKEIDSEIDKTNIQKETRSTRSKMKVQHKPVGLENPVKESLNKELSEEESDKAMRNTHTITRQKKRSHSNSIEHAEKKKSKSHSGSEKDFSTTRQTEYEDAVSVIENNQNQPAANATYIASSKQSTPSTNENIAPSYMNSTVVVENPKIVTNTEPLEERPKTPPQVAKKDGNKQIFSPFDKTPVKKKIEAFERLEDQCSGIPIKATGTKKKPHKYTEEENQHSSEKLLTPVTSNFIPKLCSTSRITKQHPIYSSNTSTNSESILSMKSASALKASQAEFREREKRRQEKEREALRKKEALLQAQTEEKRRKREEKQQRAQQQREMREKEMQKQLEAHRIKEEKFKQAMAERDKKLKKQNEEAEKKRQMAKKKATELRKEKEEEMRMAEMNAVADKQGEVTKMTLKQKIENGHQQSVPIYMITKPPLLPTADCYDSDNPEYDPHRKVEPAWAKDRELRDTQLAMITAGETIKNSFFCRQAHTPDLQEIFEKIDPRKLKRTSSAFWKRAPRYTLMPTLEDTIEFSEDSD